MFNVGGDLSPVGFPGMRMLVWYSSTVVGCTTFTCFEARSRLLLRRPWCFFFLCFIATWRAFAVSFATFSSIRESRGSGFFRGMLPSCRFVRCHLSHSSKSAGHHARRRLSQ